LKLCSLFNSQDKRTYFLFLFLLESTSPKTRPGLQARTWILQIPHQCTDMAGSSKHMHRRGCSPPNCQLRWWVCHSERYMGQVSSTVSRLEEWLCTHRYQWLGTGREFHHHVR
jgi:hypothetical protein